MSSNRGDASKGRRSAKLHQTTIRFSAELWSVLQQEAARTGVSVAQYVRESALARVAFSAGQRGDYEFAKSLDEPIAHPEMQQPTVRSQELRGRLASSNAPDTQEDDEPLRSRDPS